MHSKWTYTVYIVGELDHFFPNHCLVPVSEVKLQKRKEGLNESMRKT